MISCTPTSGPWSAASRVGATSLAPVTGLVDATGLSTAAFASAGRGFVAVDAQATPQTHKYMNRPGSPPRGTTR